jgi:hypothetical protein
VATLAPAAKLLPAAILANQAVAVTCQFIQRTDSTFPLLYFTVDSALLAALTAAVTLLRLCPPLLPNLRVAATVAVLLSAVTYATVIAPATPTGTWIQPHDDVWVRMATILMHGAAPVLVTLDLLLRPARGRTRRHLASGLGWPLSYLAVLSLLSSVGWAHIPYPFLRPSQVGWAPVLGAALVLMGAVVAITAALYVLQRRLGMRSHHSGVVA